ncbi:MAG: hypothetical protein F7B17_01335 [Desulfurococcales archaeon]|nr:hypothetical protein [Desulfurococcales archaeon]
MKIVWALAIIATAAQLAIALLLIYNYLRIGRTPLGKYMLVLAGLFLAQSALALTSYTYWYFRGYGVEVAAPLAMITLASLAGLTILYFISRI